MASRFTKEDHQKSLSDLEREMAKAKLGLRPGLNKYTISEKELTAAFRRLVAVYQATGGDVNLEYRFPDGTMFKINCIETAREKARRAK